MKFSNISVFIVCTLYLCLILSSCTEQKFLFFNRTTVKNPPADTPFVFNNKIIIKGPISKDDKKQLLANLDNYWDDSLFASKVQQFGLFYKLRNPPVFDTGNIGRTIKFMQAYLKSIGYYYSGFRDSVSIQSIHNQRRVTVTMLITPGKKTIIDSLTFDFDNPGLQQLALESAKNSLIKPGQSPFSTDLISNELDRLVTQFRNRGYYQLTRDNLIALVDTTDVSLLQLTLDPFEQAEKITEAQERRKENPRCSIEIEERENTDSSTAADSSAYQTFRFGKVYYYPETGFTEIPDSLMKDPSQFKVYHSPDTTADMTMYYKKGIFNFQPMRQHTYLLTGRKYNESLYYKTINNLSQIGAWRQVDSRPVIREDTVDFHIFMVPEIKQNITVDLEASRNSGDFLSSNNLFGLAVNATYLNRNVWKRAIQSSTTFSNGVELTFDKTLPLLQTFQSSLGQTYIFPNFVSPFKIDRLSRLDGVKTLFSMNGSYSDRSNFFRIRSFVTNWGYQWKKRNKIFQFTPLNIELYSLDTLAGLDSAFKVNPFLRTAFNTGSVISTQFAFNVTYPDRNHSNISNYIRFGAEATTWGSLLGLTGNLKNNLYQYVKIEGEYRRLINYRKTALALRAFAGIGYNYGNSSRFGKTLPFFKQFIAGGPNSMRAWSLRQLGLGSSLLSDTSTSSFRDRYGDMQLEGNIEYRYNIATIGSMNLGGALFTDIGNIWSVQNDPANPNGTFSFNRLGKDIAIALGTGLRFDFNYFLIRVDFGLKLKDPARIANNGWLNFSDFTWKNYEYEVKDASGKVISPNRNNYAIQLGIGLPF